MGPSDRPRRLRAVSPLDAAELPVDESAATILPGAPRVGPLDDLLRQVDDLRLTLETDLTLAAAAVEAGGPAAAAEIIEADLAGLRLFDERALGHLSELASACPSAPKTRTWGRLARVSAAPFVAAAAVVGMLLGVVPTSSGPGPSAPSTTVSAQSTFQQLTSLAAQGRTDEVRIAAQKLHNQISALVGTAKQDPAAAQQALLLLSAERNVIVSSGDGAALHDVLVKSLALAARLASALPPSLRTAMAAAPALPAAPEAPRRQQPKPGPASPSPAASKPSPTPSPKPTPSPSPKPTPSATPSPSPSDSPSATPTASSSSGPSTPFLSGPDGAASPTPGTAH